MAQFIRIADTDGGNHIINLEHVVQFIEAASDDPFESQSAYIVLTDGQKIHVESGDASNSVVSILQNYKR